MVDLKQMNTFPKIKHPISPPLSFKISPKFQINFWKFSKKNSMTGRHPKKTASLFLISIFLVNVVNSVARPRQFIFAQLIICTLCFFTCLPAAIAIFPQYGQMSTKKLEPDLAKKIEADFVTYNKGL